MTFQYPRIDTLESAGRILKMGTGKIVKVRIVLTMSITMLIPALCTGANSIDTNYKRVMEAYKTKKWELADRLSVLTRRQIEEREWKDWIDSQPIDEDVMLVSEAFVLAEDEWQRWWAENQNRLYWSEQEQIYKVRE